MKTIQEIREAAQINPDILSWAVCGTCGTIHTDNDSGYCENDHDYWVEVRDFFDPNLMTYIQGACENLKVNKVELINLIIKKNGEGKD